MGDIPDDLTSVGSHHGNQPPTETGQEVRSPDGPDPEATPASPSPALFQLVKNSEKNWIQLRVHSARAEVTPPEDDAIEEIGQYHSVDELREALADAGIDGRTAVFEDSEEENVLMDENVSSDHSWIGQPRYERITFATDEAAASDYVSSLDEPLV